VWRHGLRGGRAAARWPLSPGLAAAALCLVAAAAGAIAVAGHAVAENFLMRQADQQLRGYAGLLISRPFTLFPGSRLAPGASALGSAGRALSVEVRASRASGGQLLISAGPAPPPAAGRGWLEVAEPVRYQAEHIPFVYGAEDSSFSVNGAARPGSAGTLVVALNVTGVGRAVGSLTAACLAASGLALLALACGAAAVTWVLLRPAALAAGAEAAAARDFTGRAAAVLAAACQKTRRPLSVLAGLAEFYLERDDRGADDPGRVLSQVAEQAAVISALADGLEDAAHSVDLGGAADSVELGGAANSVDLEDAANSVDLGGAADSVDSVDLGGAANSVDLGGAANSVDDGGRAGQG